MTGLETALLGVTTALIGGGFGAVGGFVVWGKSKVGKPEFDLWCGYHEKDLSEIKTGINTLQVGQDDIFQRLVKLETRMSAVNGKES